MFHACGDSEAEKQRLVQLPGGRWACGSICEVFSLKFECYSTKKKGLKLDLGYH